MSQTATDRLKWFRRYRLKCLKAISYWEPLCCAINIFKLEEEKVGKYFHSTLWTDSFHPLKNALLLGREENIKSTQLSFLFRHLNICVALLTFVEWRQQTGSIPSVLPWRAPKNRLKHSLEIGSKGTKSSDVPPVLMRPGHVVSPILQRRLIFCDVSSHCPCLGKKRSQINDASSDGHEINRCGQEEV